ncbi:MAG: type II secretion system protein, partial [Nitrospirota bacterium]
MSGQSQRGVTLLELILVMMLIGILAAIIVAPVMTGASAWNKMSRQKEVVQQARIGLERLV